MRHLVLASTSPFRRSLLDRLAIPYEAVPPPLDEVAPPHLDPRSIARLLAEEKARSLAPRYPEALILGADQTLDIDGDLLRKPTSLDEAAAQLQRLAGRTHALHAAVALHAPREAQTIAEVITVELRMRPLTARHIERYLELDRPIGSVGGYLFEQRGTWLFDDVQNADEAAIVGLPLVAVCRLLRRFGVDLLSP